jgi:pilus assembly protein CpaB
MGKYKPIILLALGFVLALVTSIITYDWLQKKAEADITKPLQTQEVAIAKMDVTWGDVMTEDMVDMVPYLKDTLPEGHFTDKSSLEGRVVITPIKAKEPVFESSLAPTSVTNGGVAAVISPNKRAMAVKVDKVIGVSGFIHPGNRVDVLVTLRKSDKKDPITKTVLENIHVLAAGTKVEKDSKGKKSVKVDVITLEVDPIEAEKLAHAATEGKIQLAMRNFTDTDDVLTSGSTRTTLLASYSKAKKRKAYKRKKSNTYTVEMIKGTDVSRVRIKRR